MIEMARSGARRAWRSTWSWAMLRSTGADGRSSFRAVETRPVSRSSSCSRSTATARHARARRSRTSCARAIRDGRAALRAPVPSTRDLARQLGVSRRVAVDAYAQLAAEGYLLLRQGARPRVSETAAPRAARRRAAEPRAAAGPLRLPPERPRRLRLPAPAPGCARCARRSPTITDAELGYGDPRGVEALRAALADYLGRVRGVVAEPARVVVTCGYSQGLGLVCRALAARGARRIAIEDPSDPEQRRSPRRAGPGAGARRRRRATGVGVDALARAGVDAVVAHARPTSTRPASCSAGERRDRAARAGCASATRSRSRTTTTPSTATTAPPSARCRGSTRSASSTPARRARRSRPRCGSAGSSCRPRLVEPVAPREAARRPRDRRIEQHAFADFLARGELDRHLRRMRAPLPRAPRRARRRARRGAAGGGGPRHRRRPARHGRAAGGRRRGGDRRGGAAAAHRVGPMGENWADPGRPPADAAARLRADPGGGDPGRRARAGGGDPRHAVMSVCSWLRGRESRIRTPPARSALLAAMTSTRHRDRRRARPQAHHPRRHRRRAGAHGGGALGVKIDGPVDPHRRGAARGRRHLVRPRQPLQEPRRRAGRAANRARAGGPRSAPAVAAST